MKKFLFTLTMAAALSGMQANAENKIYIENTTAQAGTINLELKLDAVADAVAGYQATLKTTSTAVTVDETAVAMKAGNEIPGGDDKFIGAHNTASTGVSLNVLSYSDLCQTFDASTGKTIVTIPVTINDAGTYNFTLANIILSDATGNTTNVSDVAFTVTVEATKSLDFNGDGKVNIRDVNAFYEAYNNRGSEYDPKLDFNGDGKINIRDVNAFYEAYNNK